MTTTAQTPDYYAMTDPAIKKWHLGATERANRAYCGAVLMWPDDRRAVSLKTPAERRNYTTDPDLAKVSCGACKRNREYAYATGTTERPAPTTGTTTRRRTSTSRRAAATAAAGTGMNEYTAAQLLTDGVEQRNRARRTTASAAARHEPTVTAATAQEPTGTSSDAVDPAEQVDGSKPRARARAKGKSRAAKAAEKTAAERAQREAAQAAATAALDNIDAALAGIADNPEAPSTIALTGDAPAAE